ncbi:MAG: hypothetical protein A3H27_14135 [Acidobacteria bacterium RIFCSPLOWO2_02_FULL_59_13]|nr:MAG: hypothetical protein A3H27_14135 [Acidobacteria bacterium RIFCSPLOWO2_02_FULL_59_13]
MGLAALFVICSPLLRAQTTVEARLAALEVRIQQLESELAEARGGAPMEPRLSQVEKSVVEIQQKADFDALSFFKGMSLGGSLDAYYGYDFNKPGTRTVDFRNFDFNHNSVALNLLELNLGRPVSESSRLGYNVTFGYGPTADFVNGGDPGVTGDNLFQYYLSGLLPVGKGLTVDVGKFVTQHGAEVIESIPNWNYSRGILFAYAIPFYHFGVRATYATSESVSLAGFLVNGWNNVVDNNGAKTFGAQLVLSNNRASFVQNYMTGPENDDDNDNFRHLFDTLLTVKLHDKVTFMTNFDYGWNRLTDGQSAHWIGTANYMRFQFSGRFALTPRFEFFNDPQGFTTGTRQQLKEITITPEFLINEHMITRLEYRRDWSNAATFVRGASLDSGSSQDTATIGVMLTF